MFIKTRFFGILAAALIWLPMLAQGPAQLSLRDVPILAFPAQDNAALLAAEMELRAPGRAPHFAISHDTDARPSTHGVWKELANGMMSWRLRIQSPNAESINLGFIEYYMPAGGKLFLYPGDQKDPLIHGPFSPADNEVHNQLWTQIIDGDDLVIEVILPATERDNLRLRLSKVNHDFMGFSTSASGSCNLDVICSEADGWGIVDGYRDIIQSVAVISLGGGTFCTGFLVNNANNDCRPLFMTAAHCGVGPGDAPSLVTYWNYISDVCRQPNSAASGAPGGPLPTDFNTGSTHLATNAPSDMTILELDDDVSPTADAFFAGWSREFTVPTDTMIAVHHPRTDEKRISFSFQDPYRGNWGAGAANIPDGDHIIIPDWDIGTTEGGSSGSPVFDRFKRVRGQLHGGGAACGNDLYDSYGYIASSWEGGFTPTTRLKDYLDPNNTGLLFIDGRYQSACAISVSSVSPSSLTNCIGENEVTYDLLVGGAFEGPVTLSIPDLPIGWVASFSENPATPGATITLTITSQEDDAGNFDWTVDATDGSNSSATTLFWNIVGMAAAAPALTTPPNGDNTASPFTSIQWMDNGSDGYEYQVANDIGFTSLVMTGMTNGTIATFDSELPGNTTFYWRVRASNICGFGDWSAPFSFTTANIQCAAPLASEDVPVELSSEGTPINFSFLEVTETIDVSFMTVSVEIEHTYVGDLRLALLAPDGTEIILMDRPGVPASGFGCNEDNLNLTFSDGASNTADDLENMCMGGGLALEGTFQPVDPLSTVFGEWEAGDWFLVVYDNADVDGGNLINWSISFCSPSETAPDFSVVWDNSQLPDGLSLCALDGGTLTFVLGEDYGPDFVVEILNGDDVLDNYTTAYNPDTRVLTVTFADFIGFSPGNYSLTAMITQGDDSGAASAPLTIEPAPGLAMLNLPPDDSQVPGDMPINFSWSAAPNAEDYTLQISLTENFTDIVEEFVVSGTTYEWTNPSIGQLFWRVTANNDCGSATSSGFRMDVLTSVHQLSDGRELSIFPNPNQGNLFVEFTGNWSGQVEAQLMSLNGQVLQNFQLEATAGRMNLDLNDLPAGTYLLELRQGQERVVERLVRMP